MDEYFTSLIEPNILEKLPLLDTMCDLMELCNDNYRELPAISNMTDTINYGELCDRIARRRHFLYSKGYGRRPQGSEVKDPESASADAIRTQDPGSASGENRCGNIIAVLSPNSMYSMELYMAIPTAGCTVIMLPNAPNALNNEQLGRIIKKFDIEALFITEAYKDVCTGLDIPVYDIHDTDDEMAEAAKVSKYDIAVICFSVNDDPANPYGAMLSHKAIMRAAHNGLFIPGRTYGQVTIAVLPLYHVFGAIRGLLTCIYTGALVYACEDMSNIVFDIPKIKPTILTLVPGLAETILSVARIKGPEFLEGIETIICGGAYCQPRLVKMAADRGISLLVGYGLTEASNIVSGNLDSAEIMDSVGKVYPGTQVRVEDGELQIRGDVVMSGYYRDPERTAEVFTEDGWLKTGDLASIDDDGYIRILGLRKNLIILPNGENIDPRELEAFYGKMPGIEDCRAVEDSLRGRPILALKVKPDMKYYEGREEADIEADLKARIKEAGNILPSYKPVTKTIVTYDTIEHGVSDRMYTVEW